MDGLQISKNQKNTSIHSYYCLCTQLSLIIDIDIRNLPLRPIDKARLIKLDEHVIKMTSVPGDTVYLVREKGIEKQVRLNCKKCLTPLFYQFEKVNVKGIFIIDGSIHKLHNEFTSSQTVSFVEKKVPTKHTKDWGKFGCTTVSTVNEVEEELEQDDMSLSYTQNASIIVDQLKRTSKSRNTNTENLIEEKRIKKNVVDI